MNFVIGPIFIGDFDPKLHEFHHGANEVDPYCDKHQTHGCEICRSTSLSVPANTEQK